MQNQFDSIDLSDNNIIILEGFPKLPRLKTLILNNNRITRISRHLEGEHAPYQHSAHISELPGIHPCMHCMPDCESSKLHLYHHRMHVYALICEICPAESIPNLMQLVLTGNRLKNLAVSLSVAGASLCLLSVRSFHVL